jgi:hypothetical protein
MMSSVPRSSPEPWWRTRADPKGSHRPGVAPYLDLPYLQAYALAPGVPVRLAAWAKDRIFLYVHADAYEGSLFIARSACTASRP